MNKKEILDLIKDVDEESSVDEIIMGTDLYKSAQAVESLKADTVQSYLETTEAGKLIAQKIGDKRVTQAQKKQEEKIKKLVAEGVAKKISEMNPEKSEKDLEIEKLRAELSQSNRTNAEFMQKTEIRRENPNLTEDVIGILINEDPDITKANVSIFNNYVEKRIKEGIDVGIKERLKSGEYQPKGNASDESDSFLKSLEADFKKKAGLN